MQDEKVEPEVTSEAKRHSSDVFSTLSAIDVSEYVEKKGQFNYLSWPHAVRYLNTAYPDATWEVEEYVNECGVSIPYMETSCGYFVKVTVTVEGISKSQTHPVLDYRNKPIEKPNAFEINTSIQRCLVKAIALHGLGIYVYAGEDLPIEPDDKQIAEGQVKQIEVLIDDERRKRICEHFKVDGLDKLTYQQASYTIGKLLEE